MVGAEDDDGTNLDRSIANATLEQTTEKTVKIKINFADTGSLT